MGPPIAFGFASFALAGAEMSGDVSLILLLSGLVSSIYFGTKLLWACVKARRWVKWMVIASYGAAMYFVLLGIGFIGACARVCG